MQEISTPAGTARALVQEAPGARGALVLGHGAGGSVSAPDLQVAARSALEGGFTIALVEQPYRVEDKRMPPPAEQLDIAWTAVVEALAFKVPVVVGGRSSGGRVACRTAAALGAVGVLCLAFPLQPPPRKSGTVPPDRRAGRGAVEPRVLGVQGRDDECGVPPAADRRQVVVLDGDHSLRK